MQADLIAIRRGLIGPAIDRPFWQEKTETRIVTLEERRTSIGLTAAEEVELGELQQLLSIEVEEANG